MARLCASRLVPWATLASLAIVMACLAGQTIGQDKEAAAKPAAAKAVKKFRGRLPNYYKKVVDQKQRQTIYKIQVDYAAKMAEIQAQLKALIDERDEKVAGVLTPEQRKVVDELTAAAKAKRNQKKTAKKKPAAE